MTKHLTLGRWIITISTHARRSWGRLHSYRSRDTTYRGWVWGRFSLGIEDWTAEVYQLCGACGSGDVGETTWGDEGWTVCQSCRAVEQGYRYVNLQEWERSV